MWNFAEKKTVERPRESYISLENLENKNAKFRACGADYVYVPFLSRDNDQWEADMTPQLLSVPLEKISSVVQKIPCLHNFET